MIIDIMILIFLGISCVFLLATILLLLFMLIEPFLGSLGKLDDFTHMYITPCDLSDEENPKKEKL